jgi:hypothetical protein
MSGPPFTGGCQCGAVRFRVDGQARRASVCHCRMCQKAMAAPFGVFVSFTTDSVIWTRGSRRRFRSSEAVARGFCGDCGTPLTFEGASAGSSIGLTLCSFDDPLALPPMRQLGRESRIAWLDGLDELPSRTPKDEAAYAAKYPPVVSRQHPDHDTETWPAR